MGQPPAPQTVNQAGQVVAAPADHLPVSVEVLRARRQHIEMLLREVLQKGVHYDKIPGTNGMSLYKAGTEILLSSFHIAIDPVVEDLSQRREGVVHYRVKAVGTDMRTGLVIGYGVGECTSNEEKYKWRKSKTDAEWASFPEQYRRIAYKQGSNGRPDYEVYQVRQNPDEVANTILKMAKKRAQVDLCMTALAVSDIFEKPAYGAQDAPQQQPPARQAPAQRTAPPQQQAAPEPAPAPAEPEGWRDLEDDHADAEPVDFEDVEEPDTTPSEHGKINSSQVEYLRKKCEEIRVVTELDLAIAMDCTRLDMIPAAEFDNALKWLRQAIR